MSSGRPGGLSLPSRVEAALAEFVRRVREAYPDAEVYLFGSYARGTWLEDSDVDVVVVSRGFRGLEFHERGALLRRLADPSIPFTILAYTPEELEEAKRRSVAIQDAAEYWVKLT